MEVRKAERRRPTRPLSPGERRIARLVARGLTNAEIAAELGIRLSSVKSHIEHIYNKIGRSGNLRVRLTLWVIENGGNCGK